MLEVKTTHHVLELRERFNITLKVAQEELAESHQKNKRPYDRKAKTRIFKEEDKVLVLLPTNHDKLLMQRKGLYVFSGCKRESNYCIEMDKKTFHLHMLNHYIERKKDEGISKNTEKGLRVEPAKVGVEIRETEEKYSVKDDE